MKLGALLIQEGVITLEQLESGLRAQVLAGGKVGTHLVQLGHLNVDTLSAYLSRALGVPAATEQMVEQAQVDAIRALPTELAAHHHACPIRFIAEGTGRTLEVAFVDPEDPLARRAVEAACGVPVRPFVAPEILIDRALERHYGLPSRVRSLPVRPGDVLPRARVDSFARAPTSFAEAMTLAEQATDPLGVAQAVIRYGRGRMEAAVFFLTNELSAVGWLGFIPGKEESAVARLSFPLDTPSSLSSALLSRAARRVRPEGSLDPEIAKMLGARRKPDELLIAPLLWRGKPYALFWAHARSLERFDDTVVDCVAAILAPAG